MSKQRDIENYINASVNTQISTKLIAQMCNCTLPTVLTFIKNNPHRFQKVSRGQYMILPLAAMHAMNHDNTPAPQIGLPHHEW